MLKYKCVIWDWNGTLLDDLEVCIKVMNNLLIKRNLPAINVDKYKKIFGFPVKDYYDKLGFDYSTEAFEEISAEFITEYQKESLSSKLNKECIAVLDFIRHMKIKQIILSASKLENLSEQVKYFGIINYFDELLGLNHIHATSKIEIGKAWLEESQYKKNEVLLVGDTIHDYETALGIGCDCVLLSDGHQSRERITISGVPVMDSLTELKEYILSEV